MPFGVYNIKTKKRMGKKALAVVPANRPLKFSQKVNRVISRKFETKYHSNQAANQTFGNSDPTTSRIFINDLIDVAQGNSDTTRVGDVLTVSRVNVRCIIEQQSMTAVAYGQPVRMIIFQWKPIGPFAAIAQPTSAEIGRLLMPGPSAAGTQDYNSLSNYNHDNRSNYRIVYDKTWHMADGGSDSSIKVLAGNIPLKKLSRQIHFTAGQTYGPDHFYLCMLGLQPELTTRITFNIRTYFKDA